MSLVRALLVTCAFIGFVSSPSASAQLSDLDCVDFSTQAEAQEFFDRVPGDPHNLDPDGDGVACEGLPLPSGNQVVAYLIIGIVLVTAVSYLALLWQRRRVSRAPKRGLEDRITELGCSLQQIASVISEIDKELSARRSAVERLKQEAERAEKLSQLSIKEVAAVTDALRGELSSSERKLFRVNLVITIIVFALSIIGSVIVNVYVP